MTTTIEQSSGTKARARAAKAKNMNHVQQPYPDMSMVSKEPAKRRLGAHDRAMGRVCELMKYKDIRITTPRYPTMFTPEKHRLVGELVRWAVLMGGDIIQKSIDVMKAEYEREDRERIARIKAEARDRNRVYVEVGVKAEPQTAGKARKAGAR